MRSTRLKIRVFLSLAALAAGLIAAAAQEQKAGWKGRITSEDGIRVVINPAEPLYGKIKLDIEEDLRIGKEGDPQAQFYRVRDIAADSQGNIYVDDMSNGRVQVFDPRGSYLRTIGRPGQGPGEFEMPTLIRIGGPKGYTHVMDRFRRINLFDGRGIFVRSVVLDGPFTAYFPDETTGFLAVMTTGSDEALTSLHALARVGEDGKTRAVLARAPHTLHMERREGGVLSVRTGFEMSLYAAPLPGNALVYGYSKDYELVILGPGDTKLLVVRKDEPRPEFTSGEKAEFAKIPVPKLRPYFFGILTDSEGRIYVQRNMNVSIKRGFGPVAVDNIEFDVFGREGVFLFRASLPPNTRVISGDRVYSYSIDEDQGIEYAQRFRITNYADLPVK